MASDSILHHARELAEPVFSLGHAIADPSKYLEKIKAYGDTNEGEYFCNTKNPIVEKIQYGREVDQFNYNIEHRIKDWEQTIQDLSSFAEKNLYEADRGAGCLRSAHGIDPNSIEIFSPLSMEVILHDPGKLAEIAPNLLKYEVLERSHPEMFATAERNNPEMFATLYGLVKGVAGERNISSSDSNILEIGTLSVSKDAVPFGSASAESGSYQGSDLYTDSQNYREAVRMMNEDPNLEDNLESALRSIEGSAKYLTEEHGVKNLDSISSFSDESLKVLGNNMDLVANTAPSLNSYATVPEFGGYLSKFSNLLVMGTDKAQDNADQIAGIGGEAGIIMGIAFGSIIIGGRLLAKKLGLKIDDLRYDPKRI